MGYLYNTDVDVQVYFCKVWALAFADHEDIVFVWENICNDKPEWGEQGQNDTTGEMINMGLMNLKGV